MMNLKMSMIQSRKELKTMIKKKKVKRNSNKKKRLNKPNQLPTEDPDNQRLTSTKLSLKIIKIPTIKQTRMI